MTYTQPLLPLLLLALGVACARQWRRRGQAGTRLLWISALALTFAAWPPTAWLTVLTLEGWYDSTPMPTQNNAGAIVVLSGHVEQPDESRPYPTAGYNTVVRCVHAAWLAKRLPELTVITSGGGATSPEQASFAATMRDLLVGLGVPRERILLEERSRSTHENALFTAELLRARSIDRIMLVTEAYHMLRSELCFRRQGIEVTPMPCQFRTAPDRWKLSRLLPHYGALRDHELALHEWLGLLWYWCRDRV